MKKMVWALALSMTLSSLNALAIYKGNPVLKNDLIERATFQLVVTNPSIPSLKLPSCTATLISKTILLTAAHCLDHNANVIFKIAYRNSEGKKIEVPVTRFHAHQSYRNSHIEGLGDVPQHDIALLKIAQGIPGAIPARLPIKSWRPAKNQEVLVAGYGRNGVERSAEEIKNSPEGKELLERAGKNPPKTEAEYIDFVAELMSLASVKPLLWTRSSAFLEEENALELPVMTLRKGDSVCSGDSGGPSYVRSSSSGLIVVGVHSTSTNAECQATRPHWWSSSTAYGHDTLVSFYIDWIYSTSAALAQ